MEDLGNIRDIIYIGITILGFLTHYWRTESKNEERHKQVKETLKKHEGRIDSLENNLVQENGRTTYIPRKECEKKHIEMTDFILTKVKAWTFRHVGNQSRSNDMQ